MKGVKNTKSEPQTFSVFWIEMEGDEFVLNQKEVEAVDSDDAASKVAAQLPTFKLENVHQAFAVPARSSACRDAFRGEFVRRVEEEEARKAALREERERALYEKLRLKFEGK